MAKLVVVKTFFSRHEAGMAKGLLQEQGIESVIQADDCGGFRPDLSLGMGNVRLLVQEEALADAKEILEVLDNPTND